MTHHTRRARLTILGKSALAAAALLAHSISGASSGINTLHVSADIAPGADFFRYINEGWLKNTEIPADRSNFGAFSELDDRAREHLRVILEESAAKPAPVGSRTQRIGALYAAFMDTATVNQRGMAPLDRDLRYIDAHLTSYEKLPAVIGELTRLGVKSPVGAFVTRDAKNPGVNALHLTQWGLGLPDRDYYLSDDKRFATTRKAYREYLSNMLQKIGTPDAGVVAQDILRFETQLAERQWSRVETRDAVKRYNPYTRMELAELGGTFDIVGTLAASGIDAERVIVGQPSYFASLGEIMRGTPLSVLSEYLRLRLAETVAPYLTDDMVELTFDFYGQTLSGTAENEPRWKRGVAAVEEAAGFLLGEEYVARHYPEEAAKRMNEMVANLIRAYAASIKELTWMGEETRVQALEKLSKFRPKIGYPAKWRSYDGLVAIADDLYGNMRRAALFEHERQLKKIGQPADPNEWFMTPQMVNAYYNPTSNEIVFPAAILQPPFFDIAADDAANYGAIGAVIGHEIGHGFDDQGSRYDGSGNLRNWWTDEDRERFEAQTRVLIEQYNAFEALPGQFVDGQFTIGENIGDIGGLSIAYEAWQLSLDGKTAPEIDDMTGSQRFFAGWAQIWRRKYREAELVKRLKSDPHAPSEFRVNGVVVHIPAFYEAWDIGPDAELYRPADQRVTIW